MIPHEKFALQALGLETLVMEEGWVDPLSEAFPHLQKIAEFLDLSLRSWVAVEEVKSGSFTISTKRVSSGKSSGLRPLAANHASNAVQFSKQLWMRSIEFSV